MRDTDRESLFAFEKLRDLADGLFEREHISFDDLEARHMIAKAAEADRLRSAIEHVVNNSPGTPESVKGYLRKALRNV